MEYSKIECSMGLHKNIGELRLKNQGRDLEDRSGQRVSGKKDQAAGWGFEKTKGISIQHQLSSSFVFFFL